MSWYRRAEDKLLRRNKNDIASVYNEQRDGSVLPYDHQVLKSQEVRLLKIVSKKDRLYIKTTVHNLDNHIEYDTISYVWGAEDASVTVPCNDGFLQITPRAYEMLAHLLLFRPKSSRPLWIDAICINQKDTDEKAVQIPLMHQIYSKAACVVVWMGPATIQVESFMADFDRVKLLARKWTAQQLNGQPVNRKLRDKMPKDASPFWLGLSDLLNREWFERLWTFQKAILATKKFIMLCGSSYIDFGDFLEFTVNGYYEIHCYIPHIQSLDVPGVKSQAELAWTACQTILNYREFYEETGGCIARDDIPLLLNCLRRRKAMEHVDRIWALTALLDDEVQRKVASLVEYSGEGKARYWETFTRFAKVLIEDFQSLDLLGIPPPMEENEDLPSWCPNLTSEASCAMAIHCSWSESFPMDEVGLSQWTERETEAYDSRRAATKLHPKRLISFTHHNKILKVHGFIVDTISEVVEDKSLLNKMEAWVDLEETHPTYTAVVAFYDKGLSLARRTIYGTDDSTNTKIPLEYLMAITQDCRIKHCSEEVYRSAFLDFKNYSVSNIQSLTDKLQTQQANNLADRFVALIGHSFFATKGGRFGISAPGCRVGDKVCVFYGSQNLHILRWEEEQGRFIDR